MVRALLLTSFALAAAAAHLDAELAARAALRLHLAAARRPQRAAAHAAASSRAIDAWAAAHCTADACDSAAAPPLDALRARAQRLLALAARGDADGALELRLALGTAAAARLAPYSLDTWVNALARVDVLAASGGAQRATPLHGAWALQLLPSGQWCRVLVGRDGASEWHDVSVDAVPVQGLLLALPAAAGELQLDAGLVARVFPAGEASLPLLVVEPDPAADCARDSLAGEGLHCTLGGREFSAGSRAHARELAGWALGRAEAGRLRRLGLDPQRGRAAAAPPLLAAHDASRSLIATLAETSGVRSVLVMRLRFSDVADNPPPAASVAALMTAAADALARMSLGACSLNLTVMPALYTLSVASGATTQQIRASAGALAAAAGYGDASGYSHFVMALPPLDRAVYGGWAGLATVLGSDVWLQATPADYARSAMVGVTVHELGHNLGAKHASSSTYVDAARTEYGSLVDLMGEPDDVATADFGPGYKHGMGWLAAGSDVLTLAPPPVSPAAAGASAALRGASTLAVADGASQAAVTRLYARGSGLASTLFLLRAHDNGTSGAAARGYRGFRVASEAAVLRASGERFLYGGYQARAATLGGCAALPAAAGGSGGSGARAPVGCSVQLADVPLTPSAIGPTLVVDASPLTTSLGDAPLEPQGALLYDRAGPAPLLLEHLGWAGGAGSGTPAVAGPWPALALRASFLTPAPDFARAEGGGCLSTGLCAAPTSIAELPRLACGSVVALAVDELNEVAALVVDAPAITAQFGGAAVQLAVYVAVNTSSAAARQPNVTAAVYAAAPVAQLLSPRTPLAAGAVATAVALGAADALSIALPAGAPLAYLALALDGARGSQATLLVRASCQRVAPGAQLASPADVTTLTVDMGAASSVQFDGEYVASGELSGGRPIYKSSKYWFVYEASGQWRLTPAGVPAATYVAQPDAAGSLLALTAFGLLSFSALPRCPASAWYSAAAASVGVACVACPPGSLASEGAASAARCVCLDGSYMLSGSCVNCPAGTFKATRGNDRALCVGCPAGSTSAPGAALCTAAPSADGAALAREHPLCDTLWIEGVAQLAGLWARDLSAADGRVRYFRNESSGGGAVWLMQSTRDAGGVGDWLATATRDPGSSYSFIWARAGPAALQTWSASAWGAGAAARATCVCPLYGDPRSGGAALTGRAAGAVAALRVACACPAGQEAAADGTRCVDCSLGSYRISAGAPASCAQCAAGRSTPSVGATGADACAVLPGAAGSNPCSGRRSWAGGACVDVDECARGGVNGGCSHACLNDADGGAHVCACRAGYSFVPGSAQLCAPCPEGYASSGGTAAAPAACAPCPAGYVSVADGAGCGCPLGYALQADAACAPASSVTLALASGSGADAGSGVFAPGAPAFVYDAAATAALARVAAVAWAGAPSGAVWSRAVLPAAGAPAVPQFFFFHAPRSEWSLARNISSDAAPRFAFLPASALDVAAAAAALGVALPSPSASAGDPASASVPDASFPAVLRAARGMLPAGRQTWQGFAGWRAQFVPVSGVLGSVVLPSASSTPSTGSAPTPSGSRAAGAASGSSAGTPTAASTAAAASPSASAPAGTRSPTVTQTPTCSLSSTQTPTTSTSPTASLSAGAPPSLTPSPTQSPAPSATSSGSGTASGSASPAGSAAGVPSSSGSGGRSATPSAAAALGPPANGTVTPASSGAPRNGSNLGSNDGASSAQTGLVAGAVSGAVLLLLIAVVGVFGYRRWAGARGSGQPGGAGLAKAVQAAGGGAGVTTDASGGVVSRVSLRQRPSIRFFVPAFAPSGSSGGGVGAVPAAPQWLAPTTVLESPDVIVVGSTGRPATAEDAARGFVVANPLRR